MVSAINTRYFSGRVEQSKGILHHHALQLKNHNIRCLGPGGHFGSRAAVAELRATILPNFMRQTGIQNLTERGLRIAVDIEKNGLPRVHLMAGPDVAAQNPQDWLTASEKWDPTASGLFFEKCAAAAQDGLAKMAFGNSMLYVGEEKDIFGVMDGDPKADIHFLILSASVFGNVMDDNFTADHLSRFVETAHHLCQRLGIINQPIRFVANTGTGFQMGPRIHMHVMSAQAGLPSLFPVDYGFTVGAGGIIAAPPHSQKHNEVISLIEERLGIKGFSPEAAMLRKGIDMLILHKLGPLRIAK